MRKFVPIILLIAIIVFGFAEIASAQSEGLVPCGGPGESPCTTCHIFQLIKNVVDFIAFRFTPVVGALMFIAAGFMLIIGGGGSTKYHAAGKTVFTNTVIAVAIIYGAWLITNFTMRSLAGNNNIATNWYSLECSGGTGGSSSTTTGGGGGTSPVSVRGSGGGAAGGSTSGGGGSSGGTEFTGGATSTSTVTHQDATSQLRAAGLDHNRNWENCAAAGQTNCTSLDGLQPATIGGAVDLKNKCGCDVVITGGTEAGHSENLEFPHSSGWKLDYRLDPELNDYIENNFEKIGDRASDGAPVYLDPDTGATYHRETTHWDVSYAGERSRFVGD